MITIQNTEHEAVCTMYVLRNYCKRIGQDSLSEALQLLGKSQGESGININFLDYWAALTFEMLKEGARKAGKPLEVDYEDCFDVVTDSKSVESVMALLTAALPKPEQAREYKKKPNQAEAVKIG